MINFANFSIVRVKIFWGLKSIDPPVPFEKFLKKNKKHLEKLLNNNQIIVIDELGNEIESKIWKSHVKNFYYQNTQETKLLENKFPQDNHQQEKLNFEKQLQENFQLIKQLLKEEELKKILYRKIKIALRESDTMNRGFLEKKSDHTAQQLKTILEKRQKVKRKIEQIETQLDLLENVTSDE